MPDGVLLDPELADQLRQMASQWRGRGRTLEWTGRVLGGGQPQAPAPIVQIIRVVTNATFTADLSSGSLTVTGCSSTSALKAGWTITGLAMVGGNGIQVGPWTIASIDSSTQITLSGVSADQIITANGVTLSAVGDGYGYFCYVQLGNYPEVSQNQNATTQARAIRFDSAPIPEGYYLARLWMATPYNATAAPSTPVGTLVYVLCDTPPLTLIDDYLFEYGEDAESAVCRNVSGIQFCWSHVTGPTSPLGPVPVAPLTDPALVFGNMACRGTYTASSVNITSGSDTFSISTSGTPPPPIVVGMAVSDNAGCILPGTYVLSYTPPDVTLSQNTVASASSASVTFSAASGSGRNPFGFVGTGLVGDMGSATFQWLGSGSKGVDGLYAGNQGSYYVQDGSGTWHACFTGTGGGGDTVVNGWIVAAGSGGGSSLTVGSTSISGGTSGDLLTDNSGTLGNASLTSLLVGLGGPSSSGHTP